MCNMSIKTLLTDERYKNDRLYLSLKKLVHANTIINDCKIKLNYSIYNLYR
jgi:hypothetical protein